MPVIAPPMGIMPGIIIGAPPIGIIGAPMGIIGGGGTIMPGIIGGGGT
jgi:hypothetical protein